MNYSTDREILLHKTLVRHLMCQHIKHSQEDPKTEDILAVYNTWPQKYLCDGIGDVDWCLRFIRRVFMTNERLWREALEIDGFIS